MLVQQPVAQSIGQVPLIRKKTNIHAQIVVERLPKSHHIRASHTEALILRKKISIRWDGCNVTDSEAPAVATMQGQLGMLHFTFFCWIIHADPTFNLGPKESNKGLLMEAIQRILESQATKRWVFLLMISFTPLHRRRTLRYQGTH